MSPIRSGPYFAPLDLIQVTIAGNTATTIGGVFMGDVTAGPFDVEGAEPQNEGHGKEAAEPDDDAAGGARALRQVEAQTIAVSGQVVLSGTIVATNSGSDIGEAGEVVSERSLIGSITGTTLTDQGGTITGANPLLGPLADNGGPTRTHALLEGSPAIDHGPVPLATFPDNENDQRGPGFPRVVGGVVDIGAYEVQPVPPGLEIVPRFTG